jgi:hypothetical protein
MSKLSELLQSRGLTSANPANPANRESEISNFSNISRGVTPNLTLAPDLERRIRAMAKRWRYTDAELAEVLALARENPAGWLRAVALDERREDEFRRAGLLPRTDA